MDKWTILPTEEDDCIGIVVYDKDFVSYTILHTIKDKDQDKAFICTNNKELYLMTRRGDTPNWDISPLPKELTDLAY